MAFQSKSHDAPLVPRAIRQLKWAAPCTLACILGCTGTVVVEERCGRLGDRLWRIESDNSAFLGAHVGDFNGDGRRDVAVFTTFELVVNLNSGHGFDASLGRSTLGLLDATARAVAVGDTDRDGYDDLALGGTSSNPPQLYRGGPGGLDTVGLSISGERAPFSIVAEDIDCDSAKEFVFGLGPADGGLNKPPTAHTYRWDGMGMRLISGVTGVGVSSPENPPVADVGDTNGDACGDMVLIGFPTAGGGLPGSASLFVGGPNGVLPSPAWQILAAAAGDLQPFRAIGVGDVDEDGFQEFMLVVAGGKTCELQVFRGAKTSPFTVAAWTVACENDHELGRMTVGDVNGDGRPDLIHGTRLYFGRAGIPPGPFGGDPGIALPNGEVVAVTDVNADGCDDYIVTTAHELTLYGGGQP